MTHKYKPSHVANFFLAKAKEENVDITPMKLLKLVYIGYGWVAAVLDKELFSEPIEAWQHGPVIPSLYHEFKHYKKDPIKEKSGEFDLETGDFIEPSIPNSDSDTLMVLNKVWESYQRFSAWTLREMTHQPDTPWSKAFKDGNGTDIPYETIAPHFKEKITAYLNAAK